MAQTTTQHLPCIFSAHLPTFTASERGFGSIFCPSCLLNAQPAWSSCPLNNHTFPSVNGLLCCTPGQALNAANDARHGLFVLCPLCRRGTCAPVGMVFNKYVFALGVAQQDHNQHVTDTNTNSACCYTLMPGAQGKEMVLAPKPEPVWDLFT